MISKVALEKLVAKMINTNIKFFILEKMVTHPKQAFSSILHHHLTWKTNVCLGYPILECEKGIGL